VYASNEAQVKIGNRISTGFRTTKRLIQGCGLSPSLFKIYLASVLYNWNKKCKGMGLPIGNQTRHHHFADDKVITAQDEDAVYMAKEINRRISEMGLKCKYS
jgi:hypothetical protein